MRLGAYRAPALHVPLQVLMRNVGHSLLLLFCASAFAAPDHRPVAVFWVGEGALKPNSAPVVDIQALGRSYGARGYRVLCADFATPEALRELVLSDRAAHPRSYASGAVVPFVLHGKEKSASDVELIAAFLDGIGE